MDAENANNGIARTERGFVIAGTRITLYDVMGYVTAGYPAALIREKLHLAEPQVEAALDYIAAHRAEGEAEYRKVLAGAEENRAYWEARRPRRPELDGGSTPAERAEALRAKLARQAAGMHAYADGHTVDTRHETAG